MDPPAAVLSTCLDLSPPGGAEGATQAGITPLRAFRIDDDVSGLWIEWAGE